MIKNRNSWHSHSGAGVKNLTAAAWVAEEAQVQSPTLYGGLKGSVIVVTVVQVAAAAPIQSLAWELPYATGAAMKTNKQTETHVCTPDWSSQITLQHSFLSSFFNRPILYPLARVNETGVPTPPTKCII